MKLSKIIISITLLSMISGCISVGTPQRERRLTFIVECSRPSQISPVENPQQTVLRLRKFRTADPYDSRRMYILNGKTGEIKALTTGAFAVTTATTAADITRRWLSASGIFSDVFDQSVIPPGDATTLDGWLDQACVVTIEDKHMFSLKMSLWLTTTTNAHETARQRFDCTETFPMTGTEPAEIAAAFGQALGQALTKVEAALR